MLRPLCITISLLYYATALPLPFLMADARDLIPVQGKPGLYKKVIVKKDDVKLYSEPNGQVIETVPAFSIFFQLRTPDGQESSGGWIRVGDGDGTPFGWLEESVVIPWHTRFLLKPKAVSRDPKAPAFTIKHRTNKGEALFIYRGGGTEKESLVPILEELDDQSNPRYKVAFFAGRSSAAVQKSVAEQQRIQSDPLTLEIVFVIDTTASMTPLLEGVKTVTRNVAASLRGTTEGLRHVKFGLVEYRDLTPQITFNNKPARVVTKLTDLNSFQQALSPLSVATIGSEEVSEDVLAGLVLALNDAGWSPKSSKHIILLGDASAHLSGPKNSTGHTIDSVLSLARKTSGTDYEQSLDTITFHAVRADNPESPPDELALCEQQFRKLAQNNGLFEGFYANLKPNDPADRKRVEDALVDFLRRGFTAVEAAQKGDQQAVKQAAENRETGQLALATYELLLLSGTADPDPVEEGEASIRSEDGDLLAVHYVMVSETDLRRLRSTLDLLWTDLSAKVSPTARGDVKKLLERLQETLLIGTTGQEFDENTQLQDVITSLPLKTDVLRTTVAALAQKDASSFKKWLEDLDAAKKQAETLLQNQKEWHKLSENAANEKFCYVLLDNLP